MIKQKPSEAYSNGFNYTFKDNKDKNKNIIEKSTDNTVNNSLNNSVVGKKKEKSNNLEFNSNDEMNAKKSLNQIMNQKEMNKDPYKNLSSNNKSRKDKEDEEEQAKSLEKYKNDVLNNRRSSKDRGTAEFKSNEVEDKKKKRKVERSNSSKKFRSKNNSNANSVNSNYQSSKSNVRVDQDLERQNNQFKNENNNNTNYDKLLLNQNKSDQKENLEKMKRIELLEKIRSEKLRKAEKEKIKDKEPDNKNNGVHLFNHNEVQLTDDSFKNNNFKIFSKYDTSKKQKKQEDSTHSCNVFEKIYRDTILYNKQINLKKCGNCLNDINLNSLEFYMQKYHDDLIIEQKKKLERLIEKRNYDNFKEVQNMMSNKASWIQTEKEKNDKIIKERMKAQTIEKSRSEKKKEDKTQIPKVAVEL